MGDRERLIVIRDKKKQEVEDEEEKDKGNVRKKSLKWKGKRSRVGSIIVTHKCRII